MNHPTSLLAEYVDDALAPSERKRVEAHLRTCNQCSSQVTAATTGRDALRNLAIEEVPFGLTSAVIAQAASEGQPSTAASAASVHLRPSAERDRYAGLYKVVAAAAVIAVIGFFAASLFREGGEDVVASQASAPEDFMKVQDADPGKFDRDGNYTAGELTAYAEREVRAYAPSETPAEAAVEQDTGEATYAASPSPAAQVPSNGASRDVTTAAGDGDASKAASVPSGARPISNSGRYRECLDAIGAYDHGGRLVASFEGRYLDVPAYFASLTEGPVAGLPHDRLVVWVLRRDDCWVLAFTQQRFPLATPSPLPTDYMHPIP